MPAWLVTSQRKRELAADNQNTQQPGQTRLLGMDIRALRRKFPPIVKKTGEIHAIVETPQGSRNKFTFDPQAQVFQLGFAMPAGFEFPFEFAFVPGTLGEDGDPLDLLVLMDAPTFVGCLVKCRLVGVIEAVKG